MFSTWARRVTASFVQGIARGFQKLGMTPNAVTILGAVLNAVVAVLISQGWHLAGGLLLILAAGLDAIDGSLARLMGGGTRFGAFLDSVLDRVSEALILFGLAWWYSSQGATTEVLLAYVAIVGSMLVSYARARAEAVEIDCKVGIFTRLERTIIVIVALIVGYANIGLWVLAIGAPLTALHRMIYVYQQSKKAPKEL